MTAEYVCNDKKFTVSKPEGCMMKVSMDKCTATISVEERSGRYVVSVDDGLIGGSFNEKEQALNSACRRILDKLSASTKDELCQGLNALYDKISKQQA